MSGPPSPLRHLYRGTFFFGLACGISIALTPLYLDAAHYDKQDIGLLALFFAAGLVCFALPVGAVIRRFSGKTTLGFMLLGYAICVGLFPLMESFAGIAAIRFLDGVFSVGVWVSSETILLSRTDKEHKARHTSLYAIWLACGYVAGGALTRLTAGWMDQDTSFHLAGVVALLSAGYLTWRLAPDAPVARSIESLARDPDDGGVAPADSPVLGLFWRIKTSCFAAFSYGYFQASVVLFLPLYLIESKGIVRDDTRALPAIFCFGMLVATPWVGRLADRFGHLRTVTVLSALGMCCVLGFVYLESYSWMCVAVFGAGATFASMSPVALALIGVVVQPGQLSRANSIYNVCYASGMLLGPPLSSLVFQRAGGASMLWHLGAIWLAFVLFAIVFAADDPRARGKGWLFAG